MSVGRDGPAIEGHPDDTGLEESAIKHLEFVQAVIGRLANNSFLMKGWALTVSAAFFGFSAKDVKPELALVGLVPVVFFWGLDAYFLSRERQFRRLYDAIRLKEPTVQPFSMDYRAPSDGGGTWSWWRALAARTVALFYVPIIVVGSSVIWFTANHH